MLRTRRSPEKRREQAIELQRRRAPQFKTSRGFDGQLDARFEAATGTV